MLSYSLFTFQGSETQQFRCFTWILLFSSIQLFRDLLLISFETAIFIKRNMIFSPEFLFTRCMLVQQLLTYTSEITERIVGAINICVTKFWWQLLSKFVVFKMLIAPIVYRSLLEFLEGYFHDSNFHPVNLIEQCEKHKNFKNCVSCLLQLD